MFQFVTKLDKLIMTTDMVVVMVITASNNSTNPLKGKDETNLWEQDYT